MRWSWRLSALLAAGDRRARASSPLMFAALLVLAAGIFGAVRLAAPRPERPELPVALLQPNLTEEMRLSPGGAVATYRSVLAQASEAAEGQPALIVIPESALPVYWDRSETLRQDLATHRRSRVPTSSSTTSRSCPTGATTTSRGFWRAAASRASPTGRCTSCRSASTSRCRASSSSCARSRRRSATSPKRRRRRSSARARWRSASASATRSSTRRSRAGRRPTARTCS